MNQHNLTIENLPSTFIFRVDKRFLFEHKRFNDYEYVAEYDGNDLWKIHWINENNEHCDTDYTTKEVLRAINGYIWILED